MSTTTRTVNLSNEPRLKAILERHGFRFAQAEHALWRARNQNATITLYRTGKLLIQSSSSGTLSDILFGTEQRRQGVSLSSWIGTDECGKGDYFGPLTIGGVLVTNDRSEDLFRLGVRDSKQLSDPTIHQLAPQIRRLCPDLVLTIPPKLYNTLYAGMSNLNRLLAWGHAQVIEKLLSSHSCTLALTDQFGHERHLKAALMERGRQITVLQRPHAETDLAVASASILAREAYLTGLQSLSSTYGFDLPKGAGRSVIQVGRRFVSQFGKAKLTDVAKEHFVTTDYILYPHSQLSPAAQDAHIAEVLASLEKGYRRRHK